MLNFLATYWDSILCIILFIVVLIALVRKGYGYYAKQILFYLVTKAEAEFGGGTGQLKYAAVTTWLYEKLPAIAKFILTPKTVDNLIEEAVAQMKKYLEANEKAKVLITENTIK